MNASTKKLGLIAGGAVAVVVILALVVGVPMWERSQAKNIQDFLTSLPGDVKAEKVDVSFFGSSVTISNLTASFSFMPGMNYSLKIAKAEAAGVSLSAAKTMSVTTLADSLSISDFSFESSIEDIVQKGVLKEMSLRNIRMNLGALVDSVQNKKGFAALFSSLASLQIGHLAYVDYVVSMDFGMSPLVISIASVEGKDVGLLKCGPMSLNDTKAKFMGKDVFSLQNMSVSRVSVPDFFTPLLAFEDNPYMMQMQMPGILQQKFSQEPMIMEGFVLKGLYVGGFIDTPVTMESFSMDLNIGGDAIIIKSATNSLVLPPLVLEQMGSEWRSFAKVYGKALDLSGMMDLQFVMNGDTVNIAFTGEGSDKNLGNGQADWVLSLPAAGAKTIFDAMGRATPFIHSASLHLVDTGMLAAMFDASYDYESRWGTEEGINSGADMRRMAAEECFEEAREAGTKEHAAVLNGFGTFLQKGGTLDIKVTTSKPVSMEVMDEPELLNAGDITVTVENKQ